jgi:DNA-binding transcriptional LysR family regulator
MNAVDPLFRSELASASKVARMQAVETRQLRYFIAVAEEMHFGRAALRLRIAQSSLSRQVAQLEAELGVILLDRGHPPFRLTPAGAAFLPRAREVLRDLAEAADAARLASLGVVGTLPIGFVGSATYSILPDILKAHRARYPAVQLVPYVMNTSELHQALLERRIRAAFVRPRIDDSAIVNEPLLDEPLIAALPDDDSYAAGTELPLEALSECGFVLYPHHPRPSFADLILAACHGAGFRPRVAQETMDLQTALSLVSAGVGVALVPASVERSQRHGVVYRQLSPPRPHSTLTLCYRREETSAAGLALDVLAPFVNLVREHVRNAGG